LLAHVRNVKKCCCGMFTALNTEQFDVRLNYALDSFSTCAKLGKLLRKRKFFNE